MMVAETPNKQLHVVDRIYDWLAYHAAYHGDDLAVVDLDTGREFSYAEFNDRVTKLATGMRAQYGVNKGDRIVLLAHNSSDTFEVMFACWKLGAIFTPLNWRLSPIELRQLIEHADPKLIICDAHLEEQLSGLTCDRVVRGEDPASSEYERLISTHQPTVIMEGVQSDDVHSIIYTSGTTGTPKGVMYTHRITMNIVAHSNVHAALDLHSRTLVFAPLFHTAALNAGATPLFHFGGTVYVMKGWDAQACLGYITDPEMAITHFNGVPTHFVMMSELPEFEKAAFPTVKMFGIGIAPISQDLLERWLTKGAVLTQSYGMTEAFCVALTSPRMEVAKAQIGSAGHAMMHVEVMIGDAGGKELPRSEVGEVLIRGPGVMAGYYREPELTKAAFLEAGWYKTGDLAYMNEDGLLFIVDRLKDMFISGGENVYPSEIENVIDDFEAVSQVAVIAIPHSKWGEVGLALIKLREGYTISQDEVLAACTAKLARYKVPRAVRFEKSLPMSPQGKILKKELRKIYQDISIL
jgi:fatty-acyl-CoA synthase